MFVMYYYKKFYFKLLIKKYIEIIFFVFQCIVEIVLKMI